MWAEHSGRLWIPWKARGAQNVCTVDCKTGKITFGDGINGNIPQSGKAITASYQSDRDGFVSYYQAMNKIADELGMEIQVYCGSGNQVSFCAENGTERL